MLLSRIHATMPTLLMACPPWPRGQGGRPALRTAPANPRARERAARAESPYQERSLLYPGDRSRWKQQTLPQARDRAHELLLSRISNSLATQSMGYMGALITAITNPRNHAPYRPKGARALGERQKSQKTEQGSRIPVIMNPCNHAPSRPQRGASPLVETDITPRRNQGSLITAFTNPCNYAASCQRGREPSGSKRTLTHAGTRAPRSLLSRIQAAMPHHDLKFWVSYLLLILA